MRRLPDQRSSDSTLYDLRFVPTSREYDSPITKLPLKYIDPGIALEMQDKWLKDYQGIVTGNRAR